MATSTDRNESRIRAEGVSPAHNPFIGFAAGLFSGWTKLVVGHPFDTIKTRLQCSPESVYGGAWHCLKTTVQTEGFRALYKGALVPAISWGINDSILMGSLHNYRALLSSHGFAERVPGSSAMRNDAQRLSILGHSVAGSFAGWTIALFAHPVELIKCKLQLQLVRPGEYSGQFSGPIDVVRQTYLGQGPTGMWKGLGASFMSRTCLAVMFGCFEVFNRLFSNWDGTRWEMSTTTANFLAGGLSSCMFWSVALPLDTVKNPDSVTQPRYSGVFDAYRQTWRDPVDPRKSLSWNHLARFRNFYRGFVPVVLRAFPTNAAALTIWEGVMRWSAET
ncbi:MAG: hypothetical protein TREMPRED_000428 [Tremellales sp. Tagirdzhanova-0007]|nr:MAG: hypothetical protein TREMPRED_000428 [Tremellales sp. Tagirdzhanova-0007]